MFHRRHASDDLPAPAPVDKLRQSIKALKDAGFSVTTIHKRFLLLSGPPGAFEQSFDVNLKIDTANPAQDTPIKVSVFDQKNVELAEITPEPNTEIAACIASIELSTASVVNNDPPASGLPYPNIRLKKPSIYPFEIAYYLNAPPGLSAKPHINLQLPNQPEVNIVDTGHDLTHPYFSVAFPQATLDNIQLKRPDNSGNLKQLRSLESNINVLLLALNNVFEKRDDALTYLDDIAKAQKLRKSLDKLGSKLYKNLFNKIMNLGKKSSWEISNNLYNLMISTARTLSDDIKQNQYKINDALNNELLLGSIVDLANVHNKLEKGLKDIRNAISELSDVQQNNDANGHGTSMLASALSVSPKSHYVSWLSQSLAIYNNKRVVMANNTLTVLSTAIKASSSSPKRVRIYSNSWSLEVSPKIASKALKNAGAVEALTEDVVSRGDIILFAAGNAGGPTLPNVSREALAGRKGAIVVGGAYYKSQLDGVEKPKNPTVSPAAHAHLSINNKKMASPIPSVLGLVGTGGGYVMLPTTSTASASNKTGKKDHGAGVGWWSSVGGGTSSATAQLAGMCALLAGMFPNLSGKVIRQLVIENTTACTDGSSYGDVDFRALGAEKIGLANIEKAIQAGHAKTDPTESLPLFSWEPKQ